MDSVSLQELIEKYNSGNCSVEELRLLEQWYVSLEWNRDAVDINKNELHKSQAWQAIQNSKNGNTASGALLKSPIIKGALVTDLPKRSPFNRWRVAAAAVLLLLSGPLYFILHRHDLKEPALVMRPASLPNNDLTPGRAAAILTLADGSAIRLDSAANGLVTQQGNIQVIKQDGQIVYDKERGTGAGLLYNTVSTARGNQYNLVLSDGSKVWLNAGSSIRFPTTFAGKERTVEITGEAYFEIAKDIAKPFKVRIVPGPAQPGEHRGQDAGQHSGTPSEGAEIWVLGTRFNVNAYTDETSINTTLLEGAVKVIKDKTGRLLRPGQQARLKGGAIQLVDGVALDDVMAWKNGLFNFNDADIKTIMRQLARWYDVEVNFEGDIPEREFSGKISRNTNASNVLKILEQSDIHFRIEGKKIIVMP